MAIATPQSYATAGIAPDQAYNFGDIDTTIIGGSNPVPGVYTNPDYGDAEYIAATTVYPLMPVNLLDADSGGRGVYVNGSNEGIMLAAGDHPITTGAFTLVSWFSLPLTPPSYSSSSIEGLCGVYIDASNYLHFARSSKWGTTGFTGGIGIATIGIEDEYAPTRHNQDSMNLQMCAIVRDSGGDLTDFLNGVSTSLPSNWPNNCATAQLRLGNGNPFAIHIETAIFESALSESDLLKIWNRGQGTFANIT